MNSPEKTAGNTAGCMKASCRMGCMHGNYSLAAIDFHGIDIIVSQKKGAS